MLFRKKNVVEESVEKNEMEILPEESVEENFSEELPEVLFEEPSDKSEEGTYIEPESNPGDTFADMDVSHLTSQMEEKIKEEMQEEEADEETLEAEEKFKDVTKSLGYPKTIKDLIFAFGAKRKKRIKLTFVDENGQKTKKIKLTTQVVKIMNHKRKYVVTVIPEGFSDEDSMNILESMENNGII